ALPASSDSRWATWATTACTSQPARSVGVVQSSSPSSSSSWVKSSTERHQVSTYPRSSSSCVSASCVMVRNPSGRGQPQPRVREDGRMRVRAPELSGRGWLNTDGPLSLADLRGRAVLLDLWTFCCVNCLHVIEERGPLEEKYAGELVVVGVHSPKFVHEADPDALAAAVQRHGVHHPVLDDPELTTWQAYAVKAWPTLVVVDPEGYVVHVAAGEGHGEALRRVIGELVAEHEARDTLHRGDGP